MEKDGERVTVQYIDGVKISGDALHPDEAREYVRLMKESHGDIASLEVKLDGEYVDLAYYKRTIPFERIRRITGYLSLTKNFADGKKAEERDRVKHI